jgi:hypothetical protein
MGGVCVRWRNPSTPRGNATAKRLRRLNGPAFEERNTATPGEAPSGKTLTAGGIVFSGRRM